MNTDVFSPKFGVRHPGKTLAVSACSGGRTAVKSLGAQMNKPQRVMLVFAPAQKPLSWRHLFLNLNLMFVILIFKFA